MIYKLKGMNLRNIEEKISNDIYIDINENLEIGDLCLLAQRNDDGAVYVNGMWHAHSYACDNIDCGIFKIKDKLVFYDDELNTNLFFVTKIDLSEYIEKKEKEKKLKYLEKTLEEKTKNINKYIAFENLAKYDEDAKELFEEYKKLMNFNSNNLLDDKKE